MKSSAKRKTGQISNSNSPDYYQTLIIKDRANPHAQYWSKILKKLRLDLSAEHEKNTQPAEIRKINNVLATQRIQEKMHDFNIRNTHDVVGMTSRRSDSLE